MTPLRAAKPSFAELFTPKLVTVLREGYGLAALRADAFAGLTVAIVALPLSMAIAIASGLAPQNGLYAAVVGGFLVSALGGSRFQIGGPAGAFIVLVASTVAAHGVDGLLAATALSGVMLAAAGFLRLGAYVRLIPYPVTIGFTAAIAVVIFGTQVKDLLGLTIAGPEQPTIAAKLAQDFEALDTFNVASIAIAAFTIAVIVLLRRFRPGVPGILIAVTLAGAATAIFGLDVETIGTRFGGVPQGMPTFTAPALDVSKILAILPDAFAFALLGAIESLLSATVADGMTGRRHRANCELVAQGVANIAAGCFGAMPVTGTIARTATNVRSGARGPVAGMLHAAFLLAFMIVAAPLASYAPLPALAGVLAVVAWNMVEWRAIAALLRFSRGDALALGATFLLTVFRDLTSGIVAGVAIGALAFMQRMSETAGLKSGSLVVEDLADGPPEGRAPYAPDRGPAVYRLSGALFFGSAASLGAALERIVAGQRTLILDFSDASFVDTSGANAIKVFVEQARRNKIDVFVCGAGEAARRALNAGGVEEPLVRFAPTLETARELARSGLS